MTAEGDIGRIEGKVDMLITSVTDMAKTQQHMLTHGCAIGNQHTVDIDRLYKRTTAPKVGKGEPESWISIGKLKAAGWPAVVLAILLGLAYYQRLETKEVAAAVQQTKNDQEVMVTRQAQHLARMMVSEIVKELKP